MILPCSSIDEILRAGFPTITAFGGTSLITTAPAPIATSPDITPTTKPTTTAATTATATN